jgi:hypothetical protein
VSATRPPARSPEHQLRPGDPQDSNPPAGELEELEELEELGDEAIIAQQTAAHALQPRANVSEESRSVVITEHPPEPPRPPERREPSRNPPRSSAEATLVIRDRRALDEMRQKIVRRQQQKQAHRRHALYLWAALGLAAFVLGGIVAFLATDSHSDAQSADNQAPETRGEAQMTLPSTPTHKPASNGSTSNPPRAVRLDDLPVERKH